MTGSVHALISCALLMTAFTASADLYRWRDPATGSIKITSYPPYWYGDPAREKRAPRVERLEIRTTAPEKPAPAAATPAAGAAAPATRAAGAAPSPAVAASGEEGAGRIGRLRIEREALLRQMRSAAAPVAGQALTPEFQRTLDAYEATRSELDKLDPAGAMQRRAQEAQILSASQEPRPAPAAAAGTASAPPAR